MSCVCKQVASCGGREGVLVSLAETQAAVLFAPDRDATVADWRGQRRWHSQVTILEEATPFFWPPSRPLHSLAFCSASFNCGSQVSAIPAIPWVCAIPEPPNTPDQRLALRPVRLRSIALLASARGRRGIPASPGIRSHPAGHSSGRLTVCRALGQRIRSGATLGGGQSRRGLGSNVKK